MRILSVWDFKTVPYSIGDIITLIARLQIEKEILQYDKFDVAFVYDPECPARQCKYNTKGELVKSDGTQNITVKNFHKHFLPLLSTFQISKNLGSFFIFDSHEKLFKFIEQNKDYILIPSFEDIKNQVHAYRNNFKVIQDYFNKNKRFPYIECREGTIETVNRFYIELKKYAVVCHIRNTESMANRNSLQDEWMKFFSYCNQEYEAIQFILIGTKKDTANFSGFPNVIISKDYFSTVEEDMILLRQSLFFMGTRSGPLMMAFFTGTPCVIFDYNTAPHEICIKGKNFNFMNSKQKIIWKKKDKDNNDIKADFDLIKKNFEWILKKVNKDKWLKNILSKCQDNKSNLELI